MNDKIISPDLLPLAPDIPPEQCVPVYVVDDRKLRLSGNNTMHLEAPQVRVMNTLLLAGEDFLSAQEIRNRIDADESLSSLQKHIGALAAQFYEATKVGIVEVDGHDQGELAYRMSSRLSLVDLRRQVSEEHPVARLRAGIIPDELCFPETRLWLVTELLQRYGSSRQINARITELYRQNVIPLQEGRLPEGEIITAEECDECLLKIEMGIVAASFEEDLDLAESVIVEMIDAYHTLYYRHMFLIDSAARELRNQSNPYPDLMQEGSVALVDLIAKYVEYGKNINGSDENTFSEDARLAIIARLKTFCGFQDTKVITPIAARRREAIQETQRRFTEQNGRPPTFKELGKLLNLRNSEIVEALIDPRRPKLSIETFAEDDEERRFIHAMEQSVFSHEVERILSEDILLVREKIILSLRFGIFVDNLSGSTFIHRLPFRYPYGKEDMPEGQLTPLQISELLGVGVNMVQAVLRSSLRRCREYFEQHGFEATDDLL